MRLETISAWILAAYIVTFLMYDTLLVTWQVSGLFYPFYLAFVLLPALLIITRGLHVQAVPLALHLAFLAAVVAGLLRASHLPAFDVIQQLVLVLLAPLALLQVQGRACLKPVRAALAASAVPLVVWTLQAAAQQGFSNRAALASDPNVAAFYLVLTLPALASWGHAQAVRGGRVHAALAAGAFATAAAVVYAVILQASRGLLLAAVLTVVSMALLLAVRTRRLPARWWLVWLPLVALPFLPGVDVLAERFSGERVASGGLRTLIWQAAFTGHTQGGWLDVVLGRGMFESRALVTDAFVSLTSTHNAFLHVFIEYGALGFSLLAALLLLPLWRAGRLPTSDALLASGLSVALMAAAMTLNTSETFMFWVALGVASAAAWSPTPEAARP